METESSRRAALGRCLAALEYGGEACDGGARESLAGAHWELAFWEVQWCMASMLRRGGTAG